MNSTGEVLRRARNERHLTLDEVAIRTRISRKYLEAIESGDKASIPGGFFYKSFVRQYAMALSTDEDNILDEVERCLAKDDPVAPPPPDEEVLKALAVKAEETNGGRKGGPSATVYAILLLIAMIGTSGIYILWHRSEQAQAAAAEIAKSAPPVHTETAKTTTPTPPPPIVTPEPAPTIPNPATQAPSTDPGLAQPESPQPEPAEKAQTPTTTVPAPSQPVQSLTAPPAAQEPPVTAVPQQAAPPASSPVNADDKIEVSVSAKEMTWFSVLADGKRVFSGVIQPGQSRNFSAHEVARLKIGNASGVDVVYNGKSMGPLGGPKQVVMLFLTPESSELVKSQNATGIPQSPQF